MSSINTIINYPNYDNTITIKLEENGVIKRLSNITKLQLLLDGIVIADSSIDLDIFDYTTDTKIIYLKLGSISEISTEGVYKVNLVVFDTINTNGINYGKITVYTDAN